VRDCQHKKERKGRKKVSSLVRSIEKERHVAGSSKGETSLPKGTKEGLEVGLTEGEG